MILAAFFLIVNQDNTSQGVKIFFEVLCEEVFFRYLWVKEKSKLRGGRSEWIRLGEKTFLHIFEIMSYSLLIRGMNR